MKVAFITRKDPGFIPGLIVKWLTGCGAYHVGFYSEDSEYFYDMNMMRRRILWDNYFNPNTMNVEMFDCTVLEKYLQDNILDRHESYGFMDYISFLFRKLGFKVRNRSGLICSEMVNNDLLLYQNQTPWPKEGPPPSPCDLLRWYNDGIKQ
jgi:hypothetical protein